MTDDPADDSGKSTPANDNAPPDGQDSASGTTSANRLNALVYSIAGLIGRQLAREHFEALRAANDNARSPVQQGTKEGRSSPDNVETPPEC